MSETNPIPIILCGKSEFIGQRVIEALKPEIEGKKWPQYTSNTNTISRSIHLAWRLGTSHHTSSPCR